MLAQPAAKGKIVSLAYQRPGYAGFATALRAPGELRLAQFWGRRRHRRLVVARGAGELHQRLHQPRDALQSRRFVIPVAQIDELLVGTQAQPAGLALDQLDQPRRVRETVAA